MDTDRDALTVGLLTDDTLDMDSPLETVDAGYLALAALVGATDNCDLIILADGEGADLPDFGSASPLTVLSSASPRFACLFLPPWSSFDMGH